MRPRCLRGPRLAAVVLGLGALVALGAAAQTGAPARAAEQAGANGYRIGGRVVDAHSGAALARCVVQIVEVKQGRESRVVRSGEDGRFAFDGLALAKYRLSASKTGYLTQSYEQHDGFSTAIAVGPGLVSDNLVFPLTAGAILSGTVLDEAGEPVRQAQVKLYRDEDAEGIRSTRQRAVTMTDDRGAYELANLTPGAYFAAVSARPWYSQRSQMMAGRRRNMDDLDVAYPLTFYPDVTDSDAATPIPVKGGERLEADFTLRAEHAMRLRIPASQAEIKAGLGIAVTRMVFGEPDNQEVSISGDGTSMEVDGLLPGRYDVEVTRNDEGGRQTRTHLSADVADGAAQLSDSASGASVTVTGKVIANESKLPPQSGMALIVAHSRRAYFAEVNEAGEFTMSVPPGAYEVLGQINHHYLATISATGGTLVGRVLTVKAGAAPRLTVVVGNRPAQVDGVVMRDKHPASAAMVLLVPDHPGENRILFRRDQSDSDGSFTLSGVLPGHYRVVAIERGWELEWANPRVLAPFLAKSTLIDVGEGDRLQEAVELQMR